MRLFVFEGSTTEVGDILERVPLLLERQDLLTDEEPQVLPEPADTPEPGDIPEAGKQEAIPQGTPTPGKGKEGEVVKKFPPEEKGKPGKTVTWHFKDGEFTGSTVEVDGRTWTLDKNGKVKGIKIKGEVQEKKTHKGRRRIRVWYEWEFTDENDKNPKKYLVREVCFEESNICTTTREEAK